MRYLFPLLIAVFLLGACRKTGFTEPAEPTHPSMKYKIFADVEIKVGESRRFDIDDDGSEDFGFETILIGDPVLARDRLVFVSFSGISKYLLNNPQDEAPVFQPGDSIKLEHHGLEWNEVSYLTLSRKIIPGAGQPFWEGPWKDARRSFLPVQIKKQDSVYLGWFQISMDKTAEKIVVHKSGIATVANKTIVASR